jgi:hypothetical protein
MGWRHGSLLKDRIRQVVPALLAAAFPRGAQGAGGGEDLESFCRLYAGQMKPRLPESVRLELKGLSEASGVSEADLLLAEVARDGLRWHGDAARLLEAALGSPPAGDRPYVGAAIEGPDVEVLRGSWLVLERRPASAQSAATMVVTWPGGLGAIAGVSARALLVAAGEVRLPLTRESLNGPPFGIGLRVALERSRGRDDFFERLPKTSGHRVLVADAENRRRMAVVAKVGGDPQDFDASGWALATGAVEGGDSRSAALDERLGSFPARPGAGDLWTLLAAGRRAPSGPTIRLSLLGVEWVESAGGATATYGWLESTSPHAP